MYGDRGDRRYEPATLLYLERLIVEERPALTDVATPPEGAEGDR